MAKGYTREEKKKLSVKNMRAAANNISKHKFEFSSTSGMESKICKKCGKRDENSIHMMKENGELDLD